MSTLFLLMSQIDQNQTQSDHITHSLHRFRQLVHVLFVVGNDRDHHSGSEPDNDGLIIVIFKGQNDGFVRKGSEMDTQ